MKYIILPMTMLLMGSWVHSQRNLADNDLLQKYYSPDEIEHLTIIVGFFDHYVQQQTNIDDVQQAYDAFNKETAKGKNIDLNIPWDSLHAMYAEVNIPVWNSIWQYGIVATRRPGDDLRVIAPNIDVNPAGEYFQFLLALGKKNKLIDMYADQIQKSGSLGTLRLNALMDKIGAIFGKKI